ncbi:flagellar basal body rod protein FlgB [Halorhodospira abdelmalekii]|uniref:flagellar basal body rod protein FlgB n=1 Tax=Halorhodospira abdelmalekii TaxID=421629 RepID=UPI0019047D3A|nr:flagellar basal body rod protein FlgB [Halorhodospira abdelmalekii]MBK1734832.1 flagellar basal body rod protein FlgB [Halorhodospira abdelmalekii]
MRIGLDQAFSTHENALRLRGERHELLASNIANADTPNYKARDMDFRTAMREATAPSAQPLRVTHSQHLQPPSSVTAGDPKSLYRVPHGAALDGNTVEMHVEQAKFAENAINYQATLEFLNSRIRSLTSAIRGE